MDFGAEMVGGGVRFALWAPTAQSVDLVVDGIDHPLPNPAAAGGAPPCPG